MHFHYPKDSNFSLEKALSLEWLETNGLGGYASSTITNCHTRKYHGLLVSKINHMPDKYVLLNKIEDQFISGDKGSFLTSHLYPGHFEGGGFDNLQEFKIITHPEWIFDLENCSLTKEILMLHEEDTILFKYTTDRCGNSKIVLRPFLAFRNFHRLQQENFDVNIDSKILSDGFSCIPYQGMPQLFFQANVKHEFLSKSLWYRNFVYSKEKERGYDCVEDLFSPGVLILEFDSRCKIICSCSINQQENLVKKWQNELDYRNKNSFHGRATPFQKELYKASQSFITKNVSDKNSKAVVAGYHWFLEWGRDAMIALPGLTLYSGRKDLCLAVLRKFAASEKQGIIPNYLGKTKENNAYNTVDASLWFAWAVEQYYLKTKDHKSVVTFFWNTLKSIFESYKKGTLYNIKMHDNGLIYAGSMDKNLTWMDAEVGGVPVTPRFGYQVEINALWFNMLSFMKGLAKDMQDVNLAYELQELLSKIKTSFIETFWCKEKGYLYDFVNENEKNLSLRPNQIFAVSLPSSPLLLIEMAVSVMISVRSHLLTPYGLRTLAPFEDGYIGVYAGNQEKRDRAYHNGAVWPWLLGHFVEGLLKVTSDRKKVLEMVEPCLKSLEEHLKESGIGTISEVFSGDPPYNPDGCISQAWSVAEVLRLTYLLNLRE